MMAETSSDVSFIKDEDVLRKMWQETEDFGRKKEIRAHMYKLREARLREFYNSGEVTNQSHTSTMTTTTTSSNKSATSTNKSCTNMITHADNLADHSYRSLRSKEIRDSESPTRDITFKISDKPMQGWSISSNNERSSDGKLHSTTHLATTSGTETIEGGIIDYAAKHQQKTSVYRDGDDNNFTKSVGASSNTVIHQEAVAGDENTKIKATTTKTSSSLRVVTESKSSSGDTGENLQILPSNNYIDENTKVTQDTKTLPDGTIVTTTKYETRNGNSTQSSTTQKYSKTSKTTSNSHTSNVDSQSIKNFVVEQGKNITINVGSNDEQINTIRDNHDVKQTKNQASEIKTNHDVHSTIRNNDKIERIQRTEPREDVEVSNSTILIENHNVQDTKKVVKDEFIETEREHEVKSRSSKDTMQKHQPEHDTKVPEVDGQYDTTYRSDFTNKRISIEVSATHDAFARSLRAVTPERLGRNTPRSSNTSLRSTSSPEKIRHPSRVSPDRVSRERSTSPRKSSDRFASNETITYTTRRSPEKTVTKRRTNENVSITNTDTITRKKKTSIVSNGTVTKKSPNSRSPSPTGTTTSDFEYIRHSGDVVTDLDDVTVTREIKNDSVETREVTETRPSSLEINSTVRKTKKITERSPTSPLTEARKSPTRKSSLRSPTKEQSPKTPTERPVLKRTDTYEERVKQILGLSGETTTEHRRSSLERNSLKRSSFTRDRTSTPNGDSPKNVSSPTKDVPDRKSPAKEDGSPRRSPLNEQPHLRSPQEEVLPKYSEKATPLKEGPKISEFPSQIRKSPQKEPLQKYPERKSPQKEGPKISEFPSQIRKSPEKEPLEKYPERKSPPKEGPKISEFPSQIKKSPEKEPLEKYPERKSPSKEGPKISEFPSQIRQSPEREPLEKYPEKKRHPKEGPKISEFPSQIRKSPEKEPFEKYPEKKSSPKEGPKISEFPSQIRKSPEKEPLEKYPERKSPPKEGSKVSEFPSQIRKSPEKEPSEKYPERKSPPKEGPKISEFPSQIRKSPEKEPLEQYPERKSLPKDGPKISEFPSQIRKSPEREPIEKYPEKKSPPKEGPKISEFPSQIRKSPEKHLPDTKPKDYTDEFITQIRKDEEEAFLKRNRIAMDQKSSTHVIKSPEIKNPKKDAIQIQEIHSPVKKSPAKQPFESKKSPYVQEHPSQIREEKKEPTVRREPNYKPTPKATKPSKEEEENTTTEEEDNAEETLIKTVTSLEETRVPVDEKLFTKKFISQLCREDEIERTEVNKKTTLEMLEDEIHKNKTTSQIHKTVKKDQPEKSGKPKVEKLDKPTLVKKDKKPFEKTPSRRIVEVKRTPKTIPKETPTKKSPIKTTKSKFVGETEYQEEYSKTTTRKPKEPIGSVITVTKTQKATKTITNGDTPKTKQPQNSLKKPLTKQEPQTKKPVKVSKHVVTATISMCPKTKPEPPKPIVTTIKTHKITQPKKPTQNGQIHSETEEEAERTTKHDRKITRTTSEQIMKEKKFEKSPIRGTSKPELLTPTKPENKCITTKTVIINNNDSQQREVIIDLLRSKSSREPSPDRICPLPVSSEDLEDNIPRYPDQVVEPDDGNIKRQPKRLSDIPIIEGEDTIEFSRITEVDKVDETDESLLSVNKKITKFLNTTNEVTKKPIQEKPTLVVSDDLKSDECLLSVSDKVTKFITTAEELVAPKTLPERPKSPRCKNYPMEKITNYLNNTQEDSRPTKSPKSPTTRPDLIEIDDSIKNDECLLSVSDKVSKFISTAEKLTTTSPKPISLSKIDSEPSPKTPQKENTRRSPSPKTPERRISNQYADISKSYISKTERNESPTSLDSTPKSTRRPSYEEPKSFLSSSGRLRSTETVRKAKALFENIGKQQDKSSKTITNDEETRKTSYTTNDRKEEQKLVTRTRTISPEKLEVTRFRGTSPEPKTVTKSRTTYETTRLEEEESLRNEIPHYMTPLERSEKIPQEGKDRGMSPTRDTPHQALRERSTSPSTGDIPHYMTPLERCERNPREGRGPIGDTPHQKLRERSKSPFGSIPHYMTPLDRCENIPRDGRGHAVSPSRETRRERSKSPTGDRPHYMSPLDRCERNPREGRVSPVGDTAHRTLRDRSVSPSGEIPHYMTPLDRYRTTSSEIIENEMEQRPRDREPSVESDVPHYMKPLDRNLREKGKSPQPEPIVEEKRTTKFGVTLRRTDSGRNTYTTNTSTSTTERRKSSITLEKRITEEEIEEIFELELLEELLEKVVGYELRRKIRTQIRLVKKLISENRLSTYISERTKKIGGETPETHSNVVKNFEKTTKYKSSSEITKKSPNRSSPERKTIETTPFQTTTTVKTQETIPGGVKTTTTKTTEGRSFTSLKKTTIGSKTVEDDKPEWVKQRNLRKVNETSMPTGRKVVSSSTITKKSSSSTTTSKDCKPTDIITSSYGVGPTDEHGTPLFGLKALRAQNKTESKVQGTVVRSEYYSENGQEPVGEISVTKYSTDPKDLGQEGAAVSRNNGLTSVTTTQKFGYKDTPSLKNLTDKNKEKRDKDETIKTTKFTRRGSVKELSQKFIENAVETLKSERQTTYPKAGLILRTSSFKDAKNDEDQAEISGQTESESTVTVRTSSSRICGGETFLTNKTRVSGVQDVITRMKNENYEEGDTEEDVKARGLLNKFLGSQVILSGMETRVSTSAKTTINTTPSGVENKCVEVTTTVTKNGKPTTTTRVFRFPISEEELNTVWDERTLRLLLEQSSEYEERRILRARLREVMAEQEACADLVDKASEEQTTANQIEEKTESTKIVSEGPQTTTKVTKVTTTQQVARVKPLSPFAKFRQLDKQNSINKPTPPRTFN